MIYVLSIFLYQKRGAQAPSSAIIITMMLMKNFMQNHIVIKLCKFFRIFLFFIIDIL